MTAKPTAQAVAIFMYSELKITFFVRLAASVYQSAAVFGEIGDVLDG